MSCTKNYFDLSIIIPTIRNPENLKSLLSKIDRQNFLLKKKIEVIIVLQKLSFNNAKFKFNNIKKIEIVRKIKKSLSSAKNQGIKLSNGKLINFLDDDIIISHDYLKKTFSFFKENKKIDIVFGSIKIINKDKFYSRYMSDVEAKINILNLKKCLASAMIIKRQPNQIYFDERFGLGSIFPSSEETDLVYQALTKRNFRIVYFPKISLFHPDDEFLSSNLDQIRSKYFFYGVGSGGMYAKQFNNNYFFCLFYFFELIKSFIGIIVGIVKLNKYIAYKHFYLLNGKIKGFFKFLYTE